MRFLNILGGAYKLPAGDSGVRVRVMLLHIYPVRCAALDIQGQAQWVWLQRADSDYSLHVTVVMRTDARSAKPALATHGLSACAIQRGGLSHLRLYISADVAIGSGAHIRLGASRGE